MTVFGPWWGMRRLSVHFHLTRAVVVWLVQVMINLSNFGTWVVVRKNALILITCTTYSVSGKLVRDFKGIHTSHIFDVKFDMSRIVR